MILKPYLKSLFSSKIILFWSVGFVIFWLFMGVFVFTAGLSLSGNGIIGYASIWYSVSSILSIAAIGVSISFSIYYSSSSLAYLFRNSKLSSYRYYLESSIATGVFFTAVGIIFLFVLMAFFYLKFHVIIYPHILWLSIILFLSSGILFYSLSVILVLIFNNWLGLKNINFISFIPLFLGYGFGYSALFYELPGGLLYSNIISPLEYLYVFSFTGQTPWVELINPLSKHVSIVLCASSLIIWIIILLTMALLLIRRIKGSYVEEARQI
ncbi:MAG: hypothetical protein M1515_05440 [Candidatus Thermoplasmatota archaeon]|jgi:hypothetical protein|nr:hypothetical protein [Candidatus Thermoplasmatota archaeon]